MSRVWVQMLIGPFLGRFLAERFDSFAGCKSSLVSLGLMTSMSSASMSCAQAVELISPALQQSTAGPPLGRKLSEVGPSPLQWEADLKCWPWPGLSSSSKSSSGPDVCPFILHPNSSHALCQAGCAGSAGLPALSQAQQPVLEGLGRTH